jgi:hypothetical protein
MPYDNTVEKHNNMNQNDLLKELYKHLDHIWTYLYSGAHWHMKAANFSRMNMVRGLGRWHDCEAKGDFCTILRMGKIINDKLGYMPMVDMQMVSKAESYTMPDANAFKAHFDIWENNEMELIRCINAAIDVSGKIDIQIYKELICLADEVQNEIMRVCMARDSFAFGGWNPHDISVKSMLIHKYFEHEHKEGEDININLG